MWEKVLRWAKDWIMIASIAVGCILMTLTMVWHINPGEGSVVSDVVKGKDGILIFFVITTMPAWISGGLLGMLVGGLVLSLKGDEALPLVISCQYLIQIILYGLLGKLISVVVRAHITKY